MTTPTEEMLSAISASEENVKSYVSAGQRFLRNVIIFNGLLTREEIAAGSSESPATVG